MKNLLTKKPLSEKVAEAIAKIAFELVMIFLGFLNLVGKLLWKFRQWEWRIIVVVFVLSFAYTQFPFFADSPKANAVYDHPFVAPVPKAALTQYEYVMQQPHGDIVWRIYGNESTFGKAPFLYCDRQGMVNDFGFNVANHQCFQTFREEVSTVSQWFDKELKLHTLAQSLCLYNTGVLENNCRYAQDFLGL